MKNQIKLTADAAKSYKIGMKEVEGLEAAIRLAFKPVENLIRDKAYWSSDFLRQVEYKSRDGFIPHSHNCGGLEIGLVVPKCEEYEFNFLEFGECEDCGDAEKYPEGDHQCGYEGIECASDSDGHLDAYLKIWFKFEGINEDGELEFYINACGGNGDAPYFRVQHLSDIFEASFTCKSVAGLNRAASKHIKALVKVLGGK